MFNLNFIYLVESERRKDEMAAAQKQRLLRQLERHSTTRRHIMIRIGSQLVSIGNWLQRRYAELPVTYPTAALTRSQTSEC